MITYKKTVAGLTTNFSVAAREAIRQQNKIFKDWRENNCLNGIFRHTKEVREREKTYCYQALNKESLKDISVIGKIMTRWFAIEKKMITV